MGTGERVGEQCKSEWSGEQGYEKEILMIVKSYNCAQANNTHGTRRRLWNALPKLNKRNKCS